MASQNVLASPAALTYQGRILKNDGTPLEFHNVSFIFQVTNPTGSCVIYQEQVTGYNMVNSKGIFDVPIGEGTIQYPLGGGATILDMFNNSKTFNCGSCTSANGTYTCINGTGSYVAGVGDNRKLRVSFYDGIGWKTVTPDNIIRSVPFAGYALSAEKLGDKPASDFLTLAGLPNCPAGNFLTWNGSSLTCASSAIGAVTGDVTGNLSATVVSKINGYSVDFTVAPTANQVLTYNGAAWVPANLPAGGGTGTVTAVTSANGDIGIATNTTTPVLTLNSGTGANQIVKLDATAKLPAVDGSQITNLQASQIPNIDAAKIATGVVPETRGGTGESTYTDGQLLIGNTAGGLTKSTLTAGSGISITNGDGSITIAASGGSGTVTSITAGTGLNGGTITGSGTIDLANTAVTAGSYTKANITVDAQGRITAAANGAAVNVASEVTGVLPIANGGTNSSTALVNNRIMASSGGAIVEAAAINADRALISDANGIPTHSAITNTELGYLSGVTSAVQTQINGKVSASGWTVNSVMGVNNLGTLTAIPGTVNNTMLQYSASGPVWSSASYPSTTTANGLLYSSANNVVSEIATANNAVLVTNGSGVPSWSVVSNDIYTQYALLAGRAGGQTLNGGTAASENLTLQSTADATKGNVLINPAGGNVGIGTSTPAEKLDITGNIKTTGTLISNPASNIFLAENLTNAQEILAQGFPTSNLDTVLMGKKNGYLVFGQFDDYDPNFMGFIRTGHYTGLYGHTSKPEAPLTAGSNTTGLNVGDGELHLHAASNGSSTWKINVKGTEGVFFQSDLNFGAYSSGATVPYKIGVSRNNFGTNAGQDLSIVSGAAAIGSTDQNGGILNLSSGLATGSGSSAIRFLTAASGVNGTTDRIPTEKVIITGTGNVGIGTATPGYKLDVAGDVNITGNFKVNGVNISTGGVTSVTATAPLASSGGATPDISLSQANSTTNGYLSSADWTTFNNKVSAVAGSTLTDGKIWVGDATNVAAAVTPSSDVSMSNAGAFTVTKLQNRSVDSAAPSDGQVLLWDNANTTWKPQYVRMQDIRNSWGGDQMIPSSACQANESMVWSVVTDRFTCQAIGSLDASKITTGTIDSARLPASASYWSAATGGINYAGGKVGVGVAAPAAKLEVQGQMLSQVYDAGASTTIDWNNGNMQVTSASCGAFTFSNMLEGGTYTLIVTGATSGTCTFSQTSPDTISTWKFLPANGATTAATHTLYSLVRAKNVVYISWMTGF